MEKLTRKNKIILIISSVLALYAFIGFILIPLITGLILPGKLKEALKRDVNIEKISFNPFAISLKIENFEIMTKDKKNKFVSFNRFYANIDLGSSIIRLSPVIEEISLISPSSSVERVSSGEFNFSDLLEKGDDKESYKEVEEKSEDSKPVEFLIREISISKGDFTFNDSFIGCSHRVDNFNFNSGLISNFEKFKNSPAKILISSLINKAELNLNIESKPFTENLNSKISLKLKDLWLPQYYPYLKDKVNFLPESGSFSLETELGFEKNSKGEPGLEISGRAALDDFEISSMEGKKIAGFKSFYIEMDKSYPLNNLINIKKAGLENPEVYVEKKHGKINLLTLVKESSGKESNKWDKKGNKKDDKDLKSNPFLVNISSLEVSGGSLKFTDFDAPLVKSGFYKDPVINSVSGLGLEISSFSTKEKSKSKLSFGASLNEKTKINIDGEFSINPVFAELDTKIKDFNFSYSRGYIPPEIKILVKNGEFDLDLKSTLGMEKDEVNLSLSSNTSLKNLSIIERDTKKDFFSLDKFAVKGIDFKLKPMELDIKEVLVSGIDQNLLVNKEGELNLKRVFPKKEEKKGANHEKPVKKEEDKQGKGREEKDLFPVNISLIKIDDINLNYTDQSIAPYFATNIALNSGFVKGLSTKAAHGADVDIKGSIDKTSPLTIKGKMNPLLKDILVDLKIDLKNMNLTKFTPYSGKYIGRGIKKGQLNLDLYYDIEKRQLNAENRVLLDQFTLGRKIKSKDAVKLPVGLAVSLLKDRKGRIDLDIPVSGSFDDPKFKVGKVIFQVLKNLVVKAATSPFALVASITGGGEDLKFIEFKFGGSEFTNDSLRKIESIEKILYERPGLKLDITGYADPEKDVSTMKDLGFKEILNNKKVQLGMDLNAELGDEDYSSLLKKVFAQRLGSESKQGDEILTNEFMEKKIKSSINISDEDLRHLSLNRAKKIKEAILKSARVDGSRIFINDTESISPKKEGKISFARGELGLE